MRYLGSNKTSTKQADETAHYGFLKAILWSFFSRRLYIDVIKRWHGIGFAYLLVMLSVVILPYATRVMINFHQTVTQKTILPIEKLPPFSVRAGTVYFHSPMPYLVKDDQGDVIALIDTEGKIKHLPYFLYPKATVLVTKHALHISSASIDLLQPMHLSKTKERVSKFYADEDIHFVGEDWLASSGLIPVSKLLTASIYPMLWMLYFGIYISVLFSLSLFGQFLARFAFKIRLTFKQATRLMAVAATPQAVVYFMLFAWGKLYPGTGFLYMMLLAIYFSLGVLAYRRQNRAMVLQ